MAPKKRKAKAPAAAAPEPAPAPAESRGDDLWPATPLEGEAFDTLCEMLSSGGFWARLSDGEPDDGREAAKFVRIHGMRWINALHPFQDDVRMTPLARACLDSDDWRTIRALLGYGADPNIRDSNGMPPLFEMVACGDARLRSVCFMLDAGANALADYKGKSIADVARELATDCGDDVGNAHILKNQWEVIEAKLRPARFAGW